MLLHLIPTLLDEKMPANGYKLLDFTIPQLGLTLDGYKDLTICRPYPNKNYYVACRKVGARTKRNGLLVAIVGFMDRFTTVARWADLTGHVYRHTINYFIADHQFDAISDDMTLWGPLDKDHFPSRGVKVKGQEGSPMEVQPKIAVQGLPKGGNYEDRVTPRGDRERHEVFVVPTIERERLWTPHSLFHQIMPQADHAFGAKIAAYTPPTLADWPANDSGMTYEAYLHAVNEGVHSCMGESFTNEPQARQAYYTGRSVSELVEEICS